MKWLLWALLCLLSYASFSQTLFGQTKGYIIKQYDTLRIELNTPSLLVMLDGDIKHAFGFHNGVCYMMAMDEAETDEKAVIEILKREGFVQDKTVRHAPPLSTDSNNKVYIRQYTKGSTSFSFFDCSLDGSRTNIHGVAIIRMDLF